MGWERWLLHFAVAIGVAVVGVAIAVLVIGSTRAIAGGALLIAAVAVFWAVFFSARLENTTKAMARDVQRIAGRVDPPPSPRDDAPGD